MGQEVVELNFLFRHTSFAQSLRTLDTAGVSRAHMRELIQDARSEVVLRFVRCSQCLRGFPTCL